MEIDVVTIRLPVRKFVYNIVNMHAVVFCFRVLYYSEYVCPVTLLPSVSHRIALMMIDARHVIQYSNRASYASNCH